MMRSYTVRMTGYQDAGGEAVVGIGADRVAKDPDGDLVFYENAPAVGLTTEREAARFKAERWDYYYEESEDA